MTERKPRGASIRRRPSPKSKTKRKRRRQRAAPAWLMNRQDLDAIARRRCLLVLSVLSGELGVTEAAEQAQISATTYQQYETRAVEAMLAALTPDGSESGLSPSPSHRIAELEQRIVQLERDKRRADRLLLVTRKVVRPGPVTTGAGRKPKRRGRASSTNRGPKSLPSSTASSKSSTTTTSPITTAPSIQTAAGE